MLDKSDKNIQFVKDNNIDIFTDGSDNYSIDINKLKHYINIELRELNLPHWRYTVAPWR